MSKTGVIFCPPLKRFSVDEISKVGIDSQGSLAVAKKNI